MGDVVRSATSELRNVDAPIFLLGRAWYEFYKKHTRIRYAKLVFSYPVGSAEHVVHSGAFGMQNIITLFFMLGWARCGFHKWRVWTHYAEPVFLHSVGYAGHVLHFGPSGPQNVDAQIFPARVGPLGIQQKAPREMLC
jgi:hypothetical protein